MMRPLALSFALVLVGAALAACSPEVRDFSSGAGGSASSTGVTSGSGVGANGSTGVSSNSSVAVSSGTGMTQGAGDCNTDAECPKSKCVEVTPGGFRVCLDQPPEATMCMSTEDQCCSSAACKTGKCYLTSPGCGGPVVLPHNACRTDQCQMDIDCMVNGDLNQICVPAGVFGHPVRSCVYARCRLDTDCTEEPSGICAPVNDPCCGTVSMACVYPSNGCRSGADCGNQFCVFNGSRAQCVDKPPLCPV